MIASSHGLPYRSAVEARWRRRPRGKRERELLPQPGVDWMLLDGDWTRPEHRDRADAARFFSQRMSTWEATARAGCYRVKAEPQLVVETSEAATQKAKFRFQGLRCVRVLVEPRVHQRAKSGGASRNARPSSCRAKLAVVSTGQDWRSPHCTLFVSCSGSPLSRENVQKGERQ